MAGRQDKNAEYKISLDEVNEGAAVFRYRGDSAYLEYANAALGEILHFTRGECDGMDYAALMEHVHPDDRQAVWAMLRRLPEQKSGKCMYRFFEFRKHRQVWLLASGCLVETADGSAACFTYTDITRPQEALERERRLSGCLQLLTSDHDWEKDLAGVMRIVQEQYQADRVYIFEFDWAANTMSNTYEFAAEGVGPEIGNLQNLPVDTAQYWLEHFQRGEAVFIDDLADIRDDASRRAEYEALVPQGIQSLMAVPIRKHKQLFGYIGVDNPKVHSRDREFLSSIAYFLSQEYHNRQQQKKLVEMSLTDPLSHLNNRHSYSIQVTRLAGCDQNGIGILFADVNGLKYVNDHFGHLEGDKLICRAAGILKEFYEEESIFRISGDEFVVIETNVSEEAFVRSIKVLECELEQTHGSIISIGSAWQERSEDLLKLVNVAEEQMYKNKKSYYAGNPEKRRFSWDGSH